MRLSCKQCQGSGQVYATTRTSNQLSLVAPRSDFSSESISQVSDAQRNALIALVVERYALTEWEQKVKQKIAQVEEKLLAAFAEAGVDRAMAPNGIGYCRVKQWSTLSDSPYNLRQIGKLKGSWTHEPV